LLVLLEKTPAELGLWALDPAVPVDHKTGVISVLGEELPEALVPTLASFISAAHALLETSVERRGEAAYHCERLFSLLLGNPERVLPALQIETRSELRELARKLIVATAPNSSLGAAVLLKFIGRPEDAALIEVHRPAEPALSKVFDDAARACIRRPR
jgi:hypothetical protein